MQRIGAFALTSLAHQRSVRTKHLKHPEQLTPDELRAANENMTADLERTTRVADSKAPGGFWLGVSYLFWPNCPINTTNRKSLVGAQLQEKLHEWRRIPERDVPIGAHCVLCDHAACGYFGKTGVPLAESASYRNTTIPGHDGMALCRGCLLSLYALPYGCEIGGGRATALHSWDDDFLRAVTTFQVRRTRKRALTPFSGTTMYAYARQLAGLSRLRGYEETVTEGVELLVFTNSNKEQDLRSHTMNQPSSEWIRTLTRKQTGLLGRAHRWEKVPGRSVLARNLFDYPDRVLQTTARHLMACADDSGMPPASTPELAEVCSSYAEKVLMVPDADLRHIDGLAQRIAHHVNRADDNTEFKKFLQARRKLSTLRTWLQNQAIHRTLRTDEAEPFITEYQWRLLFDADDQVFFHRDLLVIGVLNHLHELDPKWRAAEPEPLADEDHLLDDDLDAENNQ
ncbi:hypothetical protein HNR23_004992 [Nocardiopsis mwathae]|uniref:Type I-B CRISPR-associated protein Cas8b1/Cst1 n=1 Tax=Nocardiopsis mwathae TaxID=1472723 RepID=A0A7X0D7S5_9ACTN|nr:hypothetical protein [Nocardiopsis mwathae]MBB6174932.1 hypothetical protein [Nocardiopsis mwathae]